MSRIEDVVTGLRYEKDPYYSYRYDQATIDDCEAAIGRPFPEELRWYLLNIGRWGLIYDHSSVLVRKGEALLCLRFKGIEDQVFAKSRYDHYLERSEGGRLKGDARFYYPLCEIEGEFNPRVILRLLVDLNEGQDYGSIWGVRPIGYYDDQTPSEPIRLADDLAGFLQQVGSDNAQRDKAEKNNEALFKRLFAEELLAPTVTPSSAATPEVLLQSFFDHRDETLFDGARNVEFDARVQGRRFETAADMQQMARVFGESLPTSVFHGSTAVKRTNVKFGKPAAYDGFVGNRLSAGFMVIGVTSTIGDGLTFDERYLLFRDGKGGQWTIVRRLEGVIKDVRVKNVGTFAFDSTYKWRLKKKLTPAWSELKTELRVSGEEDALTTGRIDFIKEIVGKAAFRPVLEQYVFDLYKTRYYPEFEAMDADEKTDWERDFPDIGQPFEIWRLMGKKSTVDIEDDATFELNMDAGFDPEHGFSLRVTNWQIV